MFTMFSHLITRNESTHGIIEERASINMPCADIILWILKLTISMVMLYFGLVVSVGKVSKNPNRLKFWLG